MSEKYLVWSIQHRLWWRPDNCGYTPIVDSAGRYSRDEAMDIAKGPGEWRHSYMANPNEIPILEQDAIELDRLNDGYLGRTPSDG